LKDASTTESLLVQYFKPELSQLPHIKRTGDIVQLKQLKVKSQAVHYRLATKDSQITGFNGKLQGISHFNTRFFIEHAPGDLTANQLDNVYDILHGEGFAESQLESEQTGSLPPSALHAKRKTAVLKMPITVNDDTSDR